MWARSQRKIRAPRTVYEDTKNAFYRTYHLRVFLVLQRPDGARIGFFQEKLLLSEIIYGIPDSRFRLVVYKLMHLRNDQLGKLVSPRGL
jgi:hypothetical protein